VFGNHYNQKRGVLGSLDHRRAVGITVIHLYIKRYKVMRDMKYWVHTFREMLPGGADRSTTRELCRPLTACSFNERSSARSLNWRSPGRSRRQNVGSGIHEEHSKADGLPQTAEDLFHALCAGVDGRLGVPVVQTEIGEERFAP